MSTITRAYIFTDGTTAFGSQVDSEVANIVTTWNNHDSGTSIWTSLKAAALTMSGNIAMASNKVTGLAAATANGDALRFEQSFYKQAPVQFTTTSATTTTSSTYQSTALTAAITPTSATARVKVTISAEIRSDNAGNTAICTLLRGATDLSGGSGFTTTGGVANQRAMIVISYIDSPASASAQTYTLQIKSSDNVNTVRFNDGSYIATIILEEIV